MRSPFQSLWSESSLVCRPIWHRPFQDAGGHRHYRFTWTSGVFRRYLPNNDLADIYQVTVATAELIDPFEVEVTGLGAFPSPTRPRVLWAGVTAPNLESLFDLQKSLVKSLARIGHRPDDDRFHPHVTLGRIKHQRPGPGDLAGLIDRHRSWSAGQCTVAEIEVFASTLGPTGSAYAVLARCPLGAKKTESRP